MVKTATHRWTGLVGIVCGVLVGIAGCSNSGERAPDGLTDLGNTAADAGDAGSAGDVEKEAGGYDGALPHPTGVYTDLVTAPLGAYITAYGVGYGTTGSVAVGGVDQTIVAYSDTKVVFTLSGSGGTLVIAGQAVGAVAVHEGRIIEVTPATIVAEVAAWQPGDVFYLHGGTYRGVIRSDGWNSESHFDLTGAGDPGRPIAVVGYPGEHAILQANDDNGDRPVFNLGDSTLTGRASHLVIANLKMITRQECVSGGGYTADSSLPESGAVDVRVVANRCEITDTTSNTMTGMISVQGDRWWILGNTLVNPANRDVIANNHGIYIQNGADDVEVGFNQLIDLRMGHVIQVHQDGTPMQYDNVWIHDNLIESSDAMSCRGMTFSNVVDASTFVVERNTLRNIGQEFSGIAIYRGRATLTDNLTYQIRAPVVDLNGQLGGSRVVMAQGNRFEPASGWPAVAAENGASLAEITLTGNAYCATSAPSEETDPQPCL